METAEKMGVTEMKLKGWYKKQEKYYSQMHEYYGGKDNFIILALPLHKGRVERGVR